MTVATMTAREAFCNALASGPLLPSSAVVIFSGDGMTRVETAVGLLRQGAAHWTIASGGVDNPPHSLHADTIAEHLVEQGLHQDRIIVDGESQNTRDQAEWLAEFLTAPPEPWEFPRVLLAVSPYHMPRAFLTVLQSLRDRDLHEQHHVIPVPASHTRWWGKPDGLEVTRMDLLADEFRKIDEYRELYGHVASYEEGLAYLKLWEGS